MSTSSAPSHRVQDALQREIGEGRWAVGDRLPSERALTRQFEVSRVAVREALTVLKSLGMVASRPGSGVYVTRNTPMTAGLDISAASHGEILDCLELRRAVEVEAARLAARRRTPLQLHEISRALDEMEARVLDGSPSADEDWSFHLAVARATNNPFFARTMATFGPTAIPRQRIVVSAGSGREQFTHERALVEEHRQILHALADGMADAAAEAMRSHLARALDRYRCLEGAPAA